MKLFFPQGGTENPDWKPCYFFVFVRTAALMVQLAPSVPLHFLNTGLGL